METPQVSRELKRDSFGRVELLDGPHGLVVRRVACGGRIPGSGLVARVLMRRERAALARLGGTTGIPRLVEPREYAAAPSLDGSTPARGAVLLRTWIEGEPLHATTSLPKDFFERLEDLVRELHVLGVCHNDLHKEPNVLVGSDGYPALVDFQLASTHARLGRPFEVRSREDLRHVKKHARRYTTHDGQLREVPNTGSGETERSFAAAFWKRFVKPVYNFVTRKLLRTKDGEPRRPSSGPWPEWEPPLGPRG